jgi:type II pantothenate kinase
MGTCLAYFTPGQAAQTTSQSVRPDGCKTPDKGANGTEYGFHKLQLEVSNAALACTTEGDLHRALELLSGVTISKRTSLRALAGRVRSPSHLLNTSSVLVAVDSAKKLEGRMGLDIGGTLAKLVYAQPAEDALQLTGTTNLQHSDLTFDLHWGADRYRLSFVSGTTSALQQVLEDQPQTDDVSSSTRRKSSLPRQVWATGGGAHAFAKAMRKMIDVEMLPLKEMGSLVDGLHFLFEHGPRDEVFIVNNENAEETVPRPSLEDMYPCLLVNMGSGVSILQINDPESDLEPYVRIGGTACGGATFLGLAQLVASSRTFPELLQLAARGDASRVNKLVRDIYGEDGCASLGLPASLTAAHFGKLISVADAKSKTEEADVVAALMIMVVQESALLARCFAQLLEARYRTYPPVFFVGGFLAGNTQGKRTIASTFRTLAMSPPFFLRHEDFLGAVGAVNAALLQQ